MSKKLTDSSPAPAATSHPRVELRRHVRRRILAPAFLDNVPEGKAVIVDISRSGLGVMILPEIEVTHLQLRFTLPGTDVLARVAGEVRWRDHTGRYGIMLVAVDCKPADWHGWFEKVKTPAQIAIEMANDGQSSKTGDATPAIGALRDTLTLTVSPEFHSRRWMALGILLIAVLAGIIVKGGSLLGPFLSSQLSHRSLAAHDHPPTTPNDNREAVQAQITIVQGPPVLAKPALSDAASAKITPGRPMHRTDPAFPKVFGIGGAVKVLLTITEKGSVEKVEVLEGDDRLASEVVSSVVHWRYLPFKVDGRPVSVRLPITITFTLQQRDRSPGSSQRR